MTQQSFTARAQTAGATTATSNGSQGFPVGNTLAVYTSAGTSSNLHQPRIETTLSFSAVEGTVNQVRHVVLNPYSLADSTEFSRQTLDSTIAFVPVVGLNNSNVPWKIQTNGEIVLKGGQKVFISQSLTYLNIQLNAVPVSDFFMETCAEGVC